MNEKITAINIADALASQLTFPKKVADLFMHAFCDTIIEGLETDGIVKVKGLGTFRIVSVDSRESVSVSTGERIVIPSFRKVAFTPEEGITDRISGAGSEPTAQTEEPVEVPPVEEFFSVIQGSEQTEKEEAPVEETPTDEFSGIDVLIATPESLEELHDRLAEALQQQTEADAAVAAAQQHLDEAKAQALQAEDAVTQAQQRADTQKAEVEHIQQLIENVETNRLTQLAAVEETTENPETPEPTEIAEAPETPIPTDVPDETPAEAKPIEPAPAVEPHHTHHKHEEKTPWWRIPLILLILLLVGAACYFVAFNPQLPLKWLNLDKKETPLQQQQPAAQPKPAAQPEPKDTIVVETVAKPSETKQNAEETKPKAAEEPKPKAEQPKPKTEQPARPKTHTVRRGESLTKISLQYYGTKDSVRAIIRANNFKDPNNINEGAVVKLP